jgi:ATP-dependent exoDNAse (exonuclease V) alpha subunit
MAATTDLDDAIQFVLNRGGSVRLIGDDRQLAAVGAGGILRDIAATSGAVTLIDSVRFANPAEVAAGAGLRDGDPAALEFYLNHDRVHVGDDTTAPAGAYAAWQADRAAGLDSLLLAGTRDTVTALNQRARADRLAKVNDESVDASRQRQVELADGTQASAGDPIVTGRNNRHLRIANGEWVKNGDRFTIDAVTPAGDLTVCHDASGRRLTLPADYVQGHVVLGYATTVHGAQGRTAATSHTVLTGMETRQQLYVAASRARAAITCTSRCPRTGDDHSPIARDILIPPTDRRRPPRP